MVNRLFGLLRLCGYRGVIRNRALCLEVNVARKGFRLSGEKMYAYITASCLMLRDFIGSY